MTSSPSSSSPPPRPARRLAWLLAFLHPFILLSHHLGFLPLPPPLPTLLFILHPLSMLHIALPSLIRSWAPHLDAEKRYSAIWQASNVNLAVAAVGVLAVLVREACREDRPPWVYPGKFILLGAGTAVVACGMTLAFAPMDSTPPIDAGIHWDQEMKLDDPERLASSKAEAAEMGEREPGSLSAASGKS